MFGKKCFGTRSLSIIAPMLWYLTFGGMHLEAAEPGLDYELTSKILRTSVASPVWLNSHAQDTPTVFDLHAGVEQDLREGQAPFAIRACESPIDNTQQWYGRPQLESANIFRGQSPESCGSLAESCGSISEGCGYAEDHKSAFKLTEFNIYPTFSYLDGLSGTYTEFEFASMTNLGPLDMENRTILNVADLPGTIAVGPTNPRASAGPAVGVRGNGFGDILSGFFFSPQGSHENRIHAGIGPVITFPTASNEILGSSQYTAGPGIHFGADLGKLTTGFFLWQSWGFGEDPGQKKVNQLFGKPFVIYELTEKWDVVYVPLGMSYGWDKPSGANVTIPVGGGLRRKFSIGSQKMAIQSQAFDYVARKETDPEWELRFTIEFIFDD